MKSTALLLFFFLTNVLLSQTDSLSEKWIQLFNGKDLIDWQVKITGHDLGDNFGNTFRVEGGLLKVVYDQYGRFDQQFGHLFYKKPFSHYKIRVEYRFVGEQAPGTPEWAIRNNGIMLHCQAPESMEKEQDFPISIEVQLLGGLGKGERPTANLCTPGTHVVLNGKLWTQHCLNSTSKTYNGDQWVTVEAVVLGDSIIYHLVEGDTVLTYEKPQIGGGVVHNFNKEFKVDGTPLKRGYISLQSEGHPTEFRKVEVLDLESHFQPKLSGTRGQ